MWYRTQVLPHKPSLLLKLSRCFHIYRFTEHNYDRYLADCQGVTFVGVVEKKIAQENCLLIGCYGECQFESESDLTEGVSVKITRTVSDQVESFQISGA